MTTDENPAHDQNKALALIATIDLGAQNAPAVHVLNIAGQMARLGHDVTLVAPTFAGSMPVALNDKKVLLVQTPNVTSWRLPNSLNALLQIAALLRLDRKSVIYLRSSPFSLPLAALARVLGFKSLFIEYNGWFADELKALGVPSLLAGIFEMSQLWEARLAKKIRVVTRGLKDILVSGKIPADKIAIIANATDLDVFGPVPRNEGLAHLKLDEQKRYMAFVGNLWPPVDMETIFKAMKLLEKRTKPVELLIIGDGRSKTDFEHLAQKHGVDDRVHFLGARKQCELKTILAAADLAIAPLHAERNERIGVSPLKVYEYAASGKPVIATKLPGISDLDVHDWIALVAPKDVRGWVEQIDHFLDIDDLSKLQLQARKCAEREFGWNQRARQIDDLIS